MSDFKFIECGSKGVHIDASLSEEEQDVDSGFILDMDKERNQLKKSNAELVKSARLIADYLENEYGDTDGVIECRRMADKHEVKQ